MPPATTTSTHVLTKKPKTTPLGPGFEGPYPILDRLGKSCLRLQTGEFANGEPRTEVRHWKTCYPAEPGLELQVGNASKPSLGRKPLRAAAIPFTPQNSY